MLSPMVAYTSRIIMQAIPARVIGSFGCLTKDYGLGERSIQVAASCFRLIEEESYVAGRGGEGEGRGGGGSF